MAAVRTGPWAELASGYLVESQVSIFSKPKGHTTYRVTQSFIMDSTHACLLRSGGDTDADETVASGTDDKIHRLFISVDIYRKSWLPCVGVSSLLFLGSQPKFLGVSSVEKDPFPEGLRGRNEKKNLSIGHRSHFMVHSFFFIY